MENVDKCLGKIKEAVRELFDSCSDDAHRVGSIAIVAAGIERVVCEALDESFKRGGENEG